MDPKALAQSLAGRERELSRLARELIERGSTGEAAQLEWFALVEQAVMTLRRSARDLEQVEEPPARGEALDLEQALEGLPDEPEPPLPSPEARALASTEGVLTGHAKVVPVSEILGFLSGMGKSGVLWVETEKEGFLVQLERGSVTYAQGDSPPKGQRLGEILVRHGAVSKEDMEAAIGQAAEEQGVLGTWLMHENLITADDLKRALTEQAQLIFHRMFGSDEASYQFEDGQRMVDSEDVRLNVIQLLLESARASDEAASLFQDQFGVPIGPSGFGEAF